MHQTSTIELRREAKLLGDQGKLIPALKRLDEIIDRDEANLDDWRSLGVMISRLGEFAQAVGAFERALQIDPTDTESTYELGRACYQLGELDRAVELIGKVARQTHSMGAWLSLATLAPGAPSLKGNQVCQLRRAYAQMVREQEGRSLKPPRSHSNQPDESKQDRKRVVAYLSAHWSDANYMKPVWPTINEHDTERLQIHLLDDSGRRNEPWSWLKNESIVRHDVSDLDNASLASLIRALNIEVLVDLSAFSKPERFGVFVHRPAPVQMAWFNSFATSGFDEFDYIIGDDAVIRLAEQPDYVEKFISLPLSYLTFQTDHEAPPIENSPFEKSGRFTFGCLGTQYKITPLVYDAWSSILRQADQARLVLASRLTKSAQNQAYVLNQFECRGIDTKRIDFLPPAEHYDFLRHYDQIDVALDTFPYNGGTTTMEAIWQGVPVLTFDGDRWASRTSATLLLRSHLKDFVADSIDDYIQRAVSLAIDPSQRTRLQLLRETMREDLAASSVCDSKSLARALEAAYINAAHAIGDS
jgi:predicted O-linked N-acetylglucosamine transferase (SPINDLY family)